MDVSSLNLPMGIPFWVHVVLTHSQTPGFRNDPPRFADVKQVIVPREPRAAPSKQTAVLAGGEHLGLMAGLLFLREWF